MSAADFPPRRFDGVMVSSTFTDLEKHRQALIRAIKANDYIERAMEIGAAKAVDVIESSLQMVREAAAYAGVISHKYGQVPECAERNPNGLSITELEFNEAQRLERPILLFLMGDAHPVVKADIEADPAKAIKLDAFRERAKRMSNTSKVHRVYATFNSLEEFERQANHALAGLRQFLGARGQEEPVGKAPPAQSISEEVRVPSPPDFHAEPPYLGSHAFVGRASQLETLDDWASDRDTHPVLLFDAIGGTGKSMLTWEWTTKRATSVRSDWAGRFWYSFYERGAVMADFCRRALAYMTRSSLSELSKMRMPELSEKLLQELRSKPWLLVLDGLERVLVAYHRHDAAQVADEEANRPTDQISDRDPCSAIHPEDDDLLRSLAASGPSKMLITSRLIPRVLLNPARQPLPGVRQVPLPGLRPPDAEALLRACGVTGGSQAIQNYLVTHCDCHPLVTGVLAGLIIDYLPDKGNFDAWVNDAGRLNLAELDLVQKRHHILLAALDAVSENARQLLSTLALVSEAVDYVTLAALYQGRPETVVRELERRGLLQYDHQTKRYDLHPVVRGVAAGRLKPEEKDRFGQRVVDHFSAQPRGPYDDAETVEDVRSGLNVVRTLIEMGRYREACAAYAGALNNALLFNLDARSEVLSLLRPLFAGGWNKPHPALLDSDAAYLANAVSIALGYFGRAEDVFSALETAIRVRSRQGQWGNLRNTLSNVSVLLRDQNRLAAEDRCTVAAMRAAHLGSDDDVFRMSVSRFDQLNLLGRFKESAELWPVIAAGRSGISRDAYRPGDAEMFHARAAMYRRALSQIELDTAERAARAGKNRAATFNTLALRGQWHIGREEWETAANSLTEAVTMARSVRRWHPEAETHFALARFRLGQLAEPGREAEHLANASKVFHRGLAELWLAIGDHEKAKQHALIAYEWAWADGEPYVRRYELEESQALLTRLGVEIPNLPPYDPTKDEKFPCEDEVLAALEKEELSRR